MVSFQTKTPNLRKFWSALDWKMHINFVAMWNILQALGKFYHHLAYFVLIWYIFPRLVSRTKKNLAHSSPGIKILAAVDKPCFQ
jgi:hypothetical protein